MLVFGEFGSPFSLRVMMRKFRKFDPTTTTKKKKNFWCKQKIHTHKEKKKEKERNTYKT